MSQVFNLSEEQWQAAIEAATEAKKNAYAPYSKFHVGAALISDQGKIFGGANVENASFGLSICAERSAVAQAVSQGETQMMAVVIVTDSNEPTPPCGMCRQVLAEFSRTMVVRSYASGAKSMEWVLGDLLPWGFSSSFL